MKKVHALIFRLIINRKLFLYPLLFIDYYQFLKGLMSKRDNSFEIES